MTQKKTSLAVFRTARINPKNDLEKRVLEVIEYWENKGINFKQLVCDRIARFDLELTPEMYAKEPIASDKPTQELLEHYTEYLLKALEERGMQLPSHTVESDEQEHGAVSRGIAQGFLARQRMVKGDEE